MKFMMVIGYMFTNRYSSILRESELETTRHLLSLNQKRSRSCPEVCRIYGTDTPHPGVPHKELGARTVL